MKSLHEALEEGRTPFHNPLTDTISALQLLVYERLKELEAGDPATYAPTTLACLGDLRLLREDGLRDLQAHTDYFSGGGLSIKDLLANKKPEPIQQYLQKHTSDAAELPNLLGLFQLAYAGAQLNAKDGQNPARRGGDVCAYFTSVTGELAARLDKLMVLLGSGARIADIAADIHEATIDLHQFLTADLRRVSHTHQRLRHHRFAQLLEQMQRDPVLAGLLPYFTSPDLLTHLQARPNETSPA